VHHRVGNNRWPHVVKTPNGGGCKPTSAGREDHTTSPDPVLPVRRKLDRSPRLTYEHEDGR
jgi:hypothetical protein